MPLVPLYAWFGLGLLATLALRARATSAWTSRVAGAPPRVLAATLVVGVLLAVVGEWATHWHAEWSGTPLTRRSPGVWLNVIDLGGRGLATLAFGALLSLALPERARAWMVQIGRGSLLAYVVHIPFCYGVLGGDLVRGCTMAEASLWLVPLMAGSVGVVFVRDALRRWWRQANESGIRRQIWAEARLHHSWCT